MNNLYEIEKKRLLAYGQMLKNDLLEQKKHQKYQKDEKLKQETHELQKHIQNTRRYDLSRRAELRDLNKSLQEDNKMLTSFKKTIAAPHTYAEEGHSFVQDIHSMDGKRLDKLKEQLHQQAQQHQSHMSNRRLIQNKIRQIENLEEERHRNRIKEIQTQSVRNYQEIKRKHQQNMNLFDKHKRLVEENDNYRDQLESFTHVNHGLLGRYNRNEYYQRKAHYQQNQDQIIKQMAEFERRKSQEVIDYKKSVGDLEQSMLKSVLLKAPRYEPKAYSNELKHQMTEDSMKKTEEKNSFKEKIEMDNIYGGVHGREREKMLKYIDKKLGIDYEKKNQNHSSVSFPMISSADNLPQAKNSSKNDNLGHQNPQLIRTEQRQSGNGLASGSNNNKHKYQQLDQNLFNSSKATGTNQSYNYNSSDYALRSAQKSYRSYDVVTGKHRFYNQQ